MELLERVQFFPKPIEVVWKFFTDVDNLNRFTPDFFDIQVLTEERPELYPGQLIDYRVTLYGIPFPWTTVIGPVEEPTHFSDSQARGPYARFDHLHQFWAVDGGTLMVDRVAFRVGWGPVGWLAQRLFVRPTLNAIFEYRRRVCDELLGGGLGLTGERRGGSV